MSASKTSSSGCWEEVVDLVEQVLARRKDAYIGRPCGNATLRVRYDGEPFALFIHCKTLLGGEGATGKLPRRGHELERESIRHREREISAGVDVPWVDPDVVTSIAHHRQPELHVRVARSDEPQICVFLDRPEPLLQLLGRFALRCGTPCSDLNHRVGIPSPPCRFSCTPPRDRGVVPWPSNGEPSRGAREGRPMCGSRPSTR